MWLCSAQPFISFLGDHASGNLRARGYIFGEKKELLGAPFSLGVFYTV